jgi:precorrin-6y C5,15-methyltransferase (decarboxylating) CbiE subunit
MRQNKVYIVGVGPGSPEFVTPAARKAIEEADIIVGWEINFLPVKALIDGQKVYLQDAVNYLRVVADAAEEARETGQTIAIVRIGDPCISGGLNGLLKIFHDFQVEIIPGISSTQIAAAAARINLDESAVISFHEEDEPLEKKQGFMLEAFRRNRHLLILTGKMQRPEETARYLMSHGVSGDTAALVGENFTLKNEKISRGSLKEIAHGHYSWLSIMVVKQGGSQ